MIAAAPPIQVPIRSLYYIIIAELSFSVHDVMVKFISSGYPVHEIVLIRSLVAIIPIFLIIWWRGGLASLKTKYYFRHVIRSLLMFGAYISFYLSLSALPLAVSVSLFFTGPIFITILSVLALKERVVPSSWIAVFVGFLGVVIMLDPGSEVIDPAAFLALLSALFYAAGSIMTRSLGRTEGSLSLVFHLMVVYIFLSSMLGLVLKGAVVDGSTHASLAFFFRAWKMPACSDLVLFLCIGLVAAAGIYCLTQAYRLEEPSKIAPFEYMAVPLSALWGWIFWNDVLGLPTVIGIILISGSGLYLFYRKGT